MALPCLPACTSHKRPILINSFLTCHSASHWLLSVLRQKKSWDTFCWFHGQLLESRRWDWSSREAKAARVCRAQCQKENSEEVKKLPFQTDYWSTQACEETTQHSGRKMRESAKTIPKAHTGQEGFPFPPVRVEDHTPYRAFSTELRRSLTW